MIAFGLGKEMHKIIRNRAGGEELLFKLIFKILLIHFNEFHSLVPDIFHNLFQTSQSLRYQSGGLLRSLT